MRDKEKITEQKMDRKEGDIMGEMMAMIRDPPKLTNQTITQPTITTQYSSWKLYENPFYYSRSSYPHHHHSISPLNYLTPSARKLAACLWDLTFIRSIMDSELDIARAKIHELKAELEFERKVRKKAETVNKKLCKQLSEERKRRQAVEDVCEKLAKEIASEKVEMDRMKKDMVEERKMLRVAEVLREERVQMKLTDAKILFEEKISELEFSTKATSESALASKKEQQQRMVGTVTSNEPTGMTSTVNSITSSNSNVRSTENKRRASPEAENPHIKRGIKGFVEFPRVVRAISSRGRHLGSKVECQKAQLRLLLRQKSPFRTDNLIMG